jgi:hypothetical protein
MYNSRYDASPLQYHMQDINTINPKINLEVTSLFDNLQEKRLQSSNGTNIFSYVDSSLDESIMYELNKKTIKRPSMRGPAVSPNTRNRQNYTTNTRNKSLDFRSRLMLSMSMQNDKIQTLQREYHDLVQKMAKNPLKTVSIGVTPGNLIGNNLNSITEIDHSKKHKYQNFEQALLTGVKA